MNGASTTCSTSKLAGPVSSSRSQKLRGFEMDDRLGLAKKVLFSSGPIFNHELVESLPTIRRRYVDGRGPRGSGGR